MKIERTKSASLMLLMALCTVSARAQGVLARAPQKLADTNAIRMIRDPHTAMLWLLERDPARPGGPGRMVLMGQDEGFQSARITGGAVGPTRKSAPVIQSGDRLVVEENSALIEARLEAVALGSAVEGAEFRLRLAIGGKVLRAVALGPGRAAFAENAGRP